MPDPENQNTTERPTGGPTPEIDMDALRSTIAQEVQAKLAEFNRDTPSNQPGSEPVKASVNPLKAVLEPIIGEDIRRANLMAEGAMDAAIFYSTNPDAKKYKDDIEKMFAALMQQGTPFTREALLKYQMGSNIDKIVEERMAAEKKKVEDAEAAALIDSGFSNRGTGQVKNAHEATDEELTNALKNVSF